MKQISDEDFNWLCYGSEEEQIIAKLTNEENILEAKIVVLEMSCEEYVSKINILSYILYRLKNGEKIDFINKSQIERLNILSEKYKILKNYEKELQLIKDNKEQIIKIIKDIFINGNYNKHILISSDKHIFLRNCQKKLKNNKFLIHRNGIRHLVHEMLENL